MAVVRHLGLLVSAHKSTQEVFLTKAILEIKYRHNSAAAITDTEISLQVRYQLHDSFTLR